MQETTATAAPEAQALAVLPPPERAAVALQSTETEKYLRGLIEKTAEITNVVDANGRHEAHSAAMSLKNARVAVTKAGKVAREDAVAFQRAVVAESDRLAAITEAEEGRLFGLRDAFDEKVAAEKAEAARKEAERKATIRARIDEILRLPAQHAGFASDVITGVLADLAKREVTAEEFAEFADEARTAIDTAASALIVLRDGAQQREEQARQDADARRLEAERIAAERAALEVQKAEQARIAAEQAAAARALAEQQAAMLAQQQAEAKRQQDESDARERAAAEQRRIEQEAADAERRKLAQAAADLEEQRAAFARERQEAIAAAEARDRAAATVTARPFDIDWDAPAPHTIEVQPPEPELPGLIEAAEQFADDAHPDDEEIIAVLCERFDLVPPQVLDLLARFDLAAARMRHAI